MTLDKKMVYRVTGTVTRAQEYSFVWDNVVEAWVWEWKDTAERFFVSTKEVMNMLDVCEHFPEYRTLTISPRRGIELRGEPASG